MHNADNEVTQEDLAAVDTIGGHMASYYEFGQSDEYAAAQEAARDFRLASIEAACREKDADIEHLKNEGAYWQGVAERLGYPSICEALEELSDIKTERDHLRAKLDEANEIITALLDIKHGDAEIGSGTPGEPVAWMYCDDDEFQPCVVVQAERAAKGMFPYWTETPLYAHPPAPAPVEAGALRALIDAAQCVLDRGYVSECIEEERHDHLALKNALAALSQPASEEGCASCHERDCGGECLG